MKDGIPRVFDIAKLPIANMIPYEEQHEIVFEVLSENLLPQTSWPMMRDAYGFILSEVTV